MTRSHPSPKCVEDSNGCCPCQREPPRNTLQAPEDGTAAATADGAIGIHRIVPNVAHDLPLETVAKAMDGEPPAQILVP